MSPYEILTLISVPVVPAGYIIKVIFDFIKKVNRAEQTRKSLIRVRKTVNGHTMSIVILENYFRKSNDAAQ